jgi:hypothetical protein
MNHQVMNDVPTRFGISNTLLPLGLPDVWGRLWLATTGLLLLILALFPNLVPSPWGGVIVLCCWVALPVCGWVIQWSRGPRVDVAGRVDAQVRLYTIVVISFGAVFTLWARHLGLSWAVVIGSLFLIEALPGIVVSLAEWWRLSSLGLFLGLMACGFGFPLVRSDGIFVLLGSAIFLGGLLSAAILYWQLRLQEHAAPFI